MNPVKLLLNAYYETLHNLLEENKDILADTIEKLLKTEIRTRRFPIADGDRFAAYRDAALAFVEERIETYNPVGLQYTFDRRTSQQAAELELQLDFYDSTEEFVALNQAAKELVRDELCRSVEPTMSDQRLHELAAELVKKAGAFPDKSIIAAYTADPALHKLPDFLVASAVEQLIAQ
jgi:hypothetical protein